MNNIVHIYAQSHWHDDAIITGNEAAIRQLREACDRALEKGKSIASATCNDGEGYSVRVLVVNQEDGDRLPVPYTEEDAQCKNQEAWDFLVELMRSHVEDHPAKSAPEYPPATPMHLRTNTVTGWE